MKTAQHLVATFILAFSLFSTATVQAQFNYVVTNGTVSITGYTGSGGAVTIPDKINGLPVTSIGNEAFELNDSITSVTIPDSVTTIADGGAVPMAGSIYGAFCGCSLANVIIGEGVHRIGKYAFANTGLTNVVLGRNISAIGAYAFVGCHSLTSISIPNGVTKIGEGAFAWCDSLTSVSIPNSVTSIEAWGFSDCVSLVSVIIGNSVSNIGPYAFAGCYSLTGISIPNSVTSIGEGAFRQCCSLRSVYFCGNAPGVSPDVYDDTTDVFYDVANATVYYLPGTIGWGTTFSGCPTVPWVLRHPVILTITANFGVQTNEFRFRISWATNASVVVEAVTTLVNSTWTPLSTNTLTGGWCDFSDAQWTNYPARFYRIRQL